MSRVKVRSLMRRVVRNPFLKGVASLTSANAVGQLILLAVVPLLTRLYTPNDFGVFAVFTAVMSVVLVASSFRYELATPLPRHEGDAEAILVIALLINLSSSVIATVAVLLFGDVIARLTNTPELGNVLWLLPIFILVAGTYKAFSFWAIRHQNFGTLAKTRVSQSVANALAQVLGGVAGLGVWGLVIGQAIGQSAGVRTLSSNLHLGQLTRRVFSRPLRSRSLIRKYKRFPIYDVPAAIVNTGSVQLPNFLLAVWFSPVVAGTYYLADRVLAKPMTMVSQAVAQVLYGDMRTLLATGKARRRCIHLLLLMTIIALPPTLLIFLYADPLFAWVFGEEWREAGLYASWLIIGLFVQFLYSPLSMALMATRGQAANFLIHLLIGSLKLGALVTAYMLNDQILAIIGIALTTALGYGIGIIIVLARLTGFSTIAEKEIETSELN